MAHRTYTVLLKPDAELGGFAATVPAIPEIVTEGNDEAHALAMAREAIAIYLRVAAERGGAGAERAGPLPACRRRGGTDGAGGSWLGIWRGW